LLIGPKGHLDDLLASDADHEPFSMITLGSVAGNE
jgi:hypothetical protein